MIDDLEARVRRMERELRLARRRFDDAEDLMAGLSWPLSAAGRVVGGEPPALPLRSAGICSGCGVPATITGLDVRSGLTFTMVSGNWAIDATRNCNAPSRGWVGGPPQLWSPGDGTNRWVRLLICCPAGGGGGLAYRVSWNSLANATAMGATGLQFFGQGGLSVTTCSPLLMTAQHSGSVISTGRMDFFA